MRGHDNIRRLFHFERAVINVEDVNVQPRRRYRQAVAGRIGGLALEHRALRRIEVHHQGAKTGDYGNSGRGAHGYRLPARGVARRVQENKIPEQAKVNAGLREIARELSLPLVATNDCHYLRREDAEAHEVLLFAQG